MESWYMLIPKNTGWQRFVLIPSHGGLQRILVCLSRSITYQAIHPKCRRKMTQTSPSGMCGTVYSQGPSRWAEIKPSMCHIPKSLLRWHQQTFGWQQRHVHGNAPYPATSHGICMAGVRTCFCQVPLFLFGCLCTRSNLSLAARIGARNHQNARTHCVLSITWF